MGIQSCFCCENISKYLFFSKGFVKNLEILRQDKRDLFILVYSNHTTDFKDQKIETEATKTCNTSFLSLKRPDFKYVIFKIVQVS